MLASYGMHSTLSKQKSIRTVSTLLHRSECRFRVRVLIMSTVLEGVSCRGSLGLGTSAWEVRAGPPVPGCAALSGPSGTARLGPASHSVSSHPLMLGSSGVPCGDFVHINLFSFSCFSLCKSPVVATHLSECFLHRWNLA